MTYYTFLGIKLVKLVSQRFVVPYLVGSRVKYRKSSNEKVPRLIEATVQRYYHQSDRYGISYEDNGLLISTTVAGGSVLPLSAQPIPPHMKVRKMPWFKGSHRKTTANAPH